MQIPLQKTSCNLSEIGSYPEIELIKWRNIIANCIFDTLPKAEGMYVMVNLYVCMCVCLQVYVTLTRKRSNLRRITGVHFLFGMYSRFPL